MELWLCVFVCLCVCVRSTELRKNELWQQMLVEYESGEWDGMKGSERVSVPRCVQWKRGQRRGREGWCDFGAAKRYFFPCAFFPLLHFTSLGWMSSIIAGSSSFLHLSSHLSRQRAHHNWGVVEWGVKTHQLWDGEKEQGGSRKKENGKKRQSV